LREKGTAVWERISLRAKLTTLSVALIGLLLIVSSAGTMALLRTYLHQNQDTVLISTVEVMRQQSPLTVEQDLATRQLRLPNLPSGYYIAFLDSSGSLVLAFSSSTSATGQLPNISNFDLQSVLSTRGLPFEVDTLGRFVQENEGAGWRLIAAPSQAFPGSVIVALPTDANNGLMNQYRNVGLVFGIFLLFLSGMAIWFTITRALRPLKEVERTAAAVAAGDTSQRLLRLEGQTEMSRVNRSLNTMLDSIDDALDARGKTLEQMRRFVADASHELRTPLVSVRGYAELYRMGALSDKAKLDDAMTRIESEAVRMTSLVESLLSLARLDDDKPLETHETDILSLCRNAAKDLSVAEYRRDIRLVDLNGAEFESTSTLIANVDQNMIKQVLINLLANASRFSPEDKSVYVAAGLADGSLVLEVRDSGEGIPKSLRDKVFERFYRADNSRNRETGGSGLGLAIVKGLVEKHGGTIKATETKGGGATLRVKLPQA
jgi:two-component system OmpR family sensor kinase